MPDNGTMDNCLTEAGRDAGFFWSGPFLYNKDGEKIARIGKALCSSEGYWASQRYNRWRFLGDLIAGQDDGMIYQDGDEEEVKRVTEEWLAEHPTPPSS